MRISDWSSDVCSSDRGGRGLPGAWVGTAYSVLYGWEAVSDPARPREAVRLVPHPAADQGDIVLIVDESIAARYLDINDPAGVRSGLARPTAGVPVANIGVADAITTCRFGSNRTQLPGRTPAAAGEAWCRETEGK